MTLSTQEQGFKHPFTALPHRTSQKARGAEGSLRPRASSPQPRGAAGWEAPPMGRALCLPVSQSCVPGTFAGTYTTLSSVRTCRWRRRCGGRRLGWVTALAAGTAGAGQRPGRGRGARSRGAAGGQRPLRHRRPQPPRPGTVRPRLSAGHPAGWESGPYRGCLVVPNQCNISPEALYKVQSIGMSV